MRAETFHGVYPPRAALVSYELPESPCGLSYIWIEMVEITLDMWRNNKVGALQGMVQAFKQGNTA